MTTPAGRFSAIIPNVTSVLVLNHGTLVNASLYTDKIDGTAAANPVLADVDGNFNFFAAPGDYDLQFVDVDVTVTQTVTVRSDPAFSAFARSRQFAQGTHVAAGAVAVTALPGDIIENVVVAGDASTYTVTLPPVAVGGPVVIKVTGAFGNVSNSVIIIPTVADTVAGVLIDGLGSIKLVQPGELIVLGSDGTQWWMVSKFHNTTSTW